jgi:hypothetical protein
MSMARRKHIKSRNEKNIQEAATNIFLLVLAEKEMMDLAPTIRGIRKVDLMNHADRAFSFTRIDSKDELMDAMFNHKWPLCYSFSHGKLLYLSDGESEDLPEYAIVTIDKTEGRFGIHGREVGRIKPMSMQAPVVPKLIQEMNAGHYIGWNPVQVVAEPKWHHSCQLCGLEVE